VTALPIHRLKLEHLKLFLQKALAQMGVCTRAGDLSSRAYGPVS
jgi:hypothetical protein